MTATQNVLNQLEEAGYDYAVAIATEAEITAAEAEEDAEPAKF